MAPPPEYDKEPKAPDKNFINSCSDDSKILYAVVKDQQQIPEHKGTAATTTAEAENNKDVETLDDGQLRALLDEAITYKCPKDREGKSSLFKELLHEVEQDEQACEAARGLSAGRGARRSGRARRELQSNSLQDLVAALAAEPAPRRARHQPPAQVSARAHHGGSLPSGVDTSFLVNEEPPAARGGYLATVRCVNPPPLAERRVSASDAHAPADADPLARRSKPTFPMTYTARATLEIGSGSVCSGRAVTTTTASNQVRTTPVTAPRNPRRPHRDNPDRLDPPLDTRRAPASPADTVTGQMKLMNAIRSKTYEDKQFVDGGGIHEDVCSSNTKGAKYGVPRGQTKSSDSKPTQRNTRSNQRTAFKHDHMNQQWVNSVHNWYESLDGIKSLLHPFANARPGTSSFPPVNKTNSSEHSINSNANNHLNSRNHKDDYIDQFYLEKNTEKTNNIVMDPNKTSDYSNNNESDITFRKQYRERVGYDLVPPHTVPTSPTYFRKTTIGTPNVSSFQSTRIKKKSSNNSSNNKSLTVCEGNESTNYQSPPVLHGSHGTSLDSNNLEVQDTANKMMHRLEKENSETKHTEFKPINSDSKCEVSKSSNGESLILPTLTDSNKDIQVIELENTKLHNVELKEMQSSSSSVAGQVHDLGTCNNAELKNDSKTQVEYNQKLLNSTRLKDYYNSFVIEELDNTSMPNSSYLTDPAGDAISTSGCESIDAAWKNEIELTDIPICKENMNYSDDFLQHLAVQQKFLKSLENPYDGSNDYCLLINDNNQEDTLMKIVNVDGEEVIDTGVQITPESAITELVTVKENTNCTENVKEKFIFAEIPNNAYVFLTFSQSFFSLTHKDNSKVASKEIENNNNVTPYTSGENNTTTKKSKKKHKNKKEPPEKGVKNHNNNAASKNALKLLLYRNNCENPLGTAGLSHNSNMEVDSAIPFTCITTPEVVASCNTTSSTSQSSVIVDPKPLQLSSSYRAVSSLTGPWALAADVPAAPAALPAALAALPDPAAQQQHRSVISSSFNGLPLSRPCYGSISTTANEEYKKSLDENGNAVQGFISPLSGSSQQKKPRRKKSTKNETVIKSHQIDGYQGNKDLNEVLRFIESNADSARGHKLGRAKHKDDSDDKGKKRSASRKDKETKVKRASSLEELSRTKLEDLTEPARPPRAPPSKPERRSWGDDAREPFYLREPDAAELTDFQTVTKKRKPRRRTDDAAADPPRPPRAPSPRRAPSDRSNDSNDDLDSVHSLPATRAPPAPHASYADIARTRNNIPDLIESCNFYAEGEACAVPIPETDYPALAARRQKGGAPAARAASRKERSEPSAPDVVADRRPPVVLLDSAARPRELDGVTFGFDVNEQLLGAAGAAGARCDLLRGTERGVPVAAGAAALRYVPPPPAPHLLHLHRIVDFVGAAWEDVVRCGGGKVRYFSE